VGNLKGEIVSNSYFIEKKGMEFFDTSSLAIINPGK